MPAKKEDLPPGVHGPIPDPSVTGYQKHEDEIVETFPIIEVKSHFNPEMLMTNFYVYTLHKPAMMLRSLFDKMRRPNSGRYYHQKFRPVPPIWECPLDDYVCTYEAESQFRREKMVDTRILKIFETLRDNCKTRNPTTWDAECKKYIEQFKELDLNWKIKYADLGTHQNAREVLMKQKNRFIEERYKARMGIVDHDPFVKKKYFG